MLATSARHRLIITSAPRLLYWLNNSTAEIAARDGPQTGRQTAQGDDKVDEDEVDEPAKREEIRHCLPAKDSRFIRIATHNRQTSWYSCNCSMLMMAWFRPYLAAVFCLWPVVHRRRHSAVVISQIRVWDAKAQCLRSTAVRRVHLTTCQRRRSAQSALPSICRRYAAVSGRSIMRLSSQSRCLTKVLLAGSSKMSCFSVLARRKQFCWALWSNERRIQQQAALTYQGQQCRTTLWHSRNPSP